MKSLVITAVLAAPLLYAQPQLKVSTSSVLPETEYTLIFEHPVSPESNLNQLEPNTVLDITPKLDGQILWTARNVATFLPSVAPELGTTYTFSTNSKLSYEGGNKVPKTTLLTLASPDFGKNYHRRFSKGNNRQPFSYLRFNDTISPQKVEKKFYYINDTGTTIPANIRQAQWSDLESTYYIKPSWEERFTQTLKRLAGQEIDKTTQWSKDAQIPNGLIISPSYPLSIGKNWRLVGKKGISNAQKTDKTNTEFQLHIWDIDPFTFKNAIPAVFADRPRSIYLNFSAEIPKEFNDDELSKLIQIHPKPKNLKFTRRYNKTLQVHGDFYTQNTWRVSISKDFEASNGLILGKASSTDVKFDFVKSGISLASYDAAQLAHGNRKFTVGTVNMREVRVQVKLLKDSEAVRAIQGYRHYTGNGNDYDDIKDIAPLPFELISGTPAFDKTFTLENKLDTSHSIELSWDEILSDKQKYASAFISVTGLPKEQLNKKSSLKRRAQSIVQLTDIGLAWKLSNKQAWVYAYSLETGKPLQNVSISMFGEDAQLIHSTKTDNDGLALLPCSEKDRHLIAKRGNDQYTVTFDNSLSTVSMWRFPVDFAWSEQASWQHRIQMYTDRNLYRPGEKVRFKGVVREYLDNDLRLPHQKEVQLSVLDPRNRPITNQKISLNALGSFDFSFDLPESAVGAFRIKVNVIDDNAETTSYKHHTFHVQEFRRNAFEVVANLPAPDVAASDVQFDLDANYYQGTPVSNGRAQWFFTSAQTGFYPDKFRDYTFGDHREYDAYYWSHYFGYGYSNRLRNAEHSNGNITLNEDGSGSVTLKIPQLEFPSPQHISVVAEVTDSRDQTITTERSITHYPTSLFYGIARNDSLTRVGDTKEISFVAVDVNGQRSEITSKAQLTVEREFHQSVKVSAPDGTTRTHNELRTETIANTDLVFSSGSPTKWNFTPQQPGRYLLTLTGTDANGNQTRSASSLHVYGKGAYPWATEDGMRIKLVSEKQSYKVGDMARILVMTPIEGTALVSVERKGIIENFRYELEADKPVIEFPITEDFAPNAFVSVLLIRGADVSPRKFKQPALKLGYCAIHVEDISKKLTVELTAPSQSIHPNTEMELTGRVLDNKGVAVQGAEVVLFAEDEGTLAVMGYQQPKPFAFFRQSLPLTLRTGVSLGYVLDDNPDHRYMGNKGFTIGGGGLLHAVGEDGAIKNRTNFDPCAAWFPSIITDKDGRFSAKFTTPDTLTRYSVFAQAYSQSDKFGSAETSFIVKKDIMLEPKPPRFANEGDSLETKVLVENTSPYSGTWEIKLKVDSLCSIPHSHSNELIKAVTMSSNESATLSFPTKFINTGETTWTWTASPVSLDGVELTTQLKKQLSDGIENTFNVAYPRPLLRQSDFYRLTSNSEPRNLVSSMSPIIMNGRGHMELEFSNSLLLEAAGASDYLLRYPYGCVEQTTSSMIPWLAVDELRDVFPSFANRSPKEVSSAIQKGVDRLLTMQTDDGGLAYWPGGSDTQDWATVYGGMGILLGMEKGAKVPEDALRKLASYLTKIAKRPINGRSERSWRNDTRARALYVLAMAGQAEHAVQNKLYQERAQLSQAARAFLALAMHHSGSDKEIAIELLTTKDATKPSKNHWMSHRADIPVRLLAWSMIDPHNAHTDNTMQQLLNQRNPQGHWTTTWVNGWAIHAMAAYGKYVESDKPASIIQLRTADGIEKIVLDKKNPTHSLKLPIEATQELVASANNKSYVRVKAASKPEIAPSGPTSIGGLAISRRYERINADGEASPLDQPRVGDLIRVSLSVLMPEHMVYIAIDDPLPSIFESVNEEFSSQKSAHSDSQQKNYRISRREYRTERTLFFLNRSWGSQRQTISYLARVTAAGTAHAPPAKVEIMYNPEQYALSEATTLTTIEADATAAE